jgi:hypothetical protein
MFSIHGITGQTGRGTLEHLIQVLGSRVPSCAEIDHSAVEAIELSALEGPRYHIADNKLG